MTQSDQYFIAAIKELRQLSFDIDTYSKISNICDSLTAAYKQEKRINILKLEQQQKNSTPLLRSNY